MNMREIKFRAWTCEEDEEQHKMSEPFWVTDLDGYYWMPPITWSDKKDIILMQYTGLKDKNGKEIYEGDVIRTVWKEILGEKYNKPQVKECPSLHPDYFHWYTELDDMEVEVIGNIHQDSHLLDTGV